MNRFTEEDIAKIPRKMEKKYHINLESKDMISWFKQRIGNVTAGSFNLKLHMNTGFILVNFGGYPEFDDVHMKDFPDADTYIAAIESRVPKSLIYWSHYQGHGPSSNQFPEYNHIFGMRITETQLQELLDRSTLTEILFEGCEEGCGCEEESPIEKIEIPHPDKVDWKMILDHLIFRIDYRETSHEYRTTPYNITHIDGTKLQHEISVESLYLLNEIQKIFSEHETEDDKLDGYNTFYKTEAKRIIRLFLDS